MISIESVLIRPGIEPDNAFIYSTWLRSYKYSSYFAKRIRPVVFFKGHHDIVSHLLKKPNVSICIASPKGDPDTILGYLVCEKAEKPVVHFIFVKDAFRGMGVAKILFESQEIHPNQMLFTHWTIPVDEMIRKWPDMTYDPYKL